MTSTMIINYILSGLGGVALALLIVIFIQIINILRVVNKMLNKAEQTVENVENFVAKPVKIGMQIADQIQHIIASFQQKAGSHQEKSHKHDND